MSRKRPASHWFSLAKPWLAGLLVLAWVAVAVEAVGHHCEADPPAHHDCAACQLAHGTLLADGSTGLLVAAIACEPAVQPVWYFACFESSDLLLASGRAPPV
jgi:hypothetical protein